jgi:hypothetical protein
MHVGQETTKHICWMPATAANPEVNGRYMKAPHFLNYCQSMYSPTQQERSRILRLLVATLIMRLLAHTPVPSSIE